MTVNPFALMALCLLAGIGLATVSGWLLPDGWEPVPTLVLALGGIVWAVREARWTARMRKQIQADRERLERLIRDIGGQS